MGEPPARHFSFDGRVCTAGPNDTVLTSVARDRMPLVHRSLQYHRPQGPFCGIGHCTGCLVRVNGRPNVRACRFEPAEGDVVATENAWPSPRWDLLSAIGVFAPGGVDTLHGLRRPAFATRLFQHLVRRLAGTGEPPTATAGNALRSPSLERSADVVVVGSGPAGRAVATELRARGQRPLVLDRALFPSPPDAVETIPATTVVFLPPPDEERERRFSLLAVREPAHGLLVHARSVVVASGGYDASLWFGGNDAPGVFAADALSALTASGRPPPFEHGVLIGGGLRAAAVLERFGDRFDAVVAPGEIRPEVVRAASDRGMLLYPRSLLLRAHGRRRVRGVRIRARSLGTETTVPCDAVVLAHRRLPNVPLFFQAGAAMEWRPRLGAYAPRVDPAGATTVRGLFATGSVAGVAAIDRVAHASALAEAIVSGSEPLREGGVLRSSSEETPHELEGYYRELLRIPGHERWVACPCADVLVAEVEAASRSGYRGIEVVKRYSSLATGLCQGRYCLPDALLVLSILEARPPPSVGFITQRPPVSPTPLAAFAGFPPPPAAVEVP